MNKYFDLHCSTFTVRPISMPFIIGISTKMLWADVFYAISFLKIIEKPPEY